MRLYVTEMAAEMVMMATGAAIGYGSPQTLTDTGLKLAKGQKGDAPTLKPTFMVFAPAVLDRVRQAVQAKFSAASPTLKKVIAAGLAAGEKEFHAGRCGEDRTIQRNESVRVVPMSHDDLKATLKPWFG